MINSLFSKFKRVIKRLFRDWNWGAFLLCPIWSIYYKNYIGLWSVSILGIICLMLLINIVGGIMPMGLNYLFGEIYMLVFFTLMFLMAAISYPTSILFPLSESHKNLETILQSSESDTKLGIIQTHPEVFFGLLCYYMIWISMAGLRGNIWLRHKYPVEKCQQINRQGKTWKFYGTIFGLPFAIVISYLTSRLWIWIVGEFSALC